MPKFRKKPVEIEAVQLCCFGDDIAFDCDDLPSWLDAALAEDGCAVIRDDGTVAIDTLEGVMTANHGDWIIKGVKGELYPCKPDIFAATHDPA